MYHEEIEAEAMKRYERFRDLTGTRVTWEQTGDHVKHVYREEARKWIEAGRPTDG